MKNITETQAIQIAQAMLKDGFTISYMNANEIEDFIWGYLYDQKLQYENPIMYVDQFGNECVAIVYEYNEEEDVERNEFGDEFVGGCATCGEDTNSSDINGNCKNCK